MRFEIYKDKKEQFRWRLLSNGRIIADSGESYMNKAHAKRMVSSIMKRSSSAKVMDITAMR